MFVTSGGCTSRIRSFTIDQPSHLTSTGTPIPPFNLYVKRITANNNSSKVSAHALFIECMTTDFYMFRDKLSDVYSSQSLPSTFVPSNFPHTKGNNKFYKLVQQHHEYLQNHRNIPLFDTTYDDMHTVVEHEGCENTFAATLSAHPAITCVSKTSNPNKWNISTDANNYSDVREFINCLIRKLQPDNIHASGTTSSTSHYCDSICSLLVDSTPSASSKQEKTNPKSPTPQVAPNKISTTSNTSTVSSLTHAKDIASLHSAISSLEARINALSSQMSTQFSKQRSEYIDLIGDEEKRSKQRLDKFVDAFTSQIEKQLETIITTLVNHVNEYINGKIRVMSPNYRKNKQSRTSSRSSTTDEDLCTRLFPSTDVPSPPRSPITNRDGSITV